MDYKRKIHVYETDLMGIVHHSNYLRFCEEARVNWCEVNGLMGTDNKDVFGLTVLETNVRHLKPAKYGDKVTIFSRAKVDGIRLSFEYKLVVNNDTICLAKTTHCCLDLDFKVKRLPNKIIEITDSKTEKEKWIEIWH